jgi:hypothetical protein
MNGVMRIKPDFNEVLLSTYVYMNEPLLLSVTINNTVLTSPTLVTTPRYQ